MARFIAIEDGFVTHFINIEKIAAIDLYGSTVVIKFSGMENDITFDGIEIECRTKDEAEKIVEKLIGERIDNGTSKT